MHGVAVDAGSGLAKALRDGRGDDARPDDWLTFKHAVLTALGPSADTVLLDAETGPQLLGAYPQGCAPMVALEADVYHITEPERITALPNHLGVSDYPRLGIGLLKFFMYYAPLDDPALNARKQDIIARVGDECARLGVTFLFEPLVYDRDTPPGTQAYAMLKPDLVTRATETFSNPRFNAQVLKVEVPVDLDFVEGFGAPVMSLAQAEAAFARAGAAAGSCELVYLSAGVPFDRFESSLLMAHAAGVSYNGFMCGRALWSEGVDVFCQGGVDALMPWLHAVARPRLDRLIKAAEG